MKKIAIAILAVFGFSTAASAFTNSTEAKAWEKQKMEEKKAKMGAMKHDTTSPMVSSQTIKGAYNEKSEDLKIKKIAREKVAMGFASDRKRLKAKTKMDPANKPLLEGTYPEGSPLPSKKIVVTPPPFAEDEVNAFYKELEAKDKAAMKTEKIVVTPPPFAEDEVNAFHKELEAEDKAAMKKESPFKGVDTKLGQETLPAEMPAMTTKERLEARKKELGALAVEAMKKRKTN